VSNDWRDWKPALPVAGGIRSHARRGGPQQSWWARRWIATLESFGVGGRLDRGRSYARRGQVMDIQIDKGAVSARVQGSRPTPYEVQINIAQISADDWDRVAEAVSGSAAFAAKLLAGEMPQDIESAFRGEGLSLFPERSKDLTTNCSCPDQVNPCKHVAAVYYLLGEEVDRDPFLIFQLRGKTRDEFISSAAVPPPAEDPPEPLDTSSFWTGGPIPADLGAPAPPVSSKAALPRRLGKFPLWRGRDDLLTTLDKIYADAAEKAAQELQLSLPGDHPST